MRISIATVTIAALFLGMTDPTWAVFKQRPPGVQTCKNWDCEGGIICSCCFAGKGCWICDNGCPGCSGPLMPDLDRCHWDPKSSGLVVQPTQPSGGFTPTNPSTRAPATRR